MAKNIAIGIQDFGDLIQKNCFYIDKTDFLREWWENNDSVTLITRPRRFGNKYEYDRAVLLPEICRQRRAV